MILRAFQTLFIAVFVILASNSEAWAAVPTEVEAFVGHSGKFFDFANDSESHQNGQACRVQLSLHDNGRSTIVIETGSKVAAQAVLAGSIKSVAGNGAIVFTTTDSGAHSAGSKCQASVPMTNFKKTVEIKDNAIVIRKKFRCGFFEKNDVMSVCDLK